MGSHENDYFDAKITENYKGKKLKVLECKLCNEEFSLDDHKLPRLLKCGHTICHSCLNKLPVLDNSILCPFDRQPTWTGNSGVLALKKNFALVDLLEELRSKGNSASTSRTRRGDKEPLVWCDEDERTLADVYCTVCKTNLCNACNEFTHSTKTLSKHERVLLSEKPKEKLKCPLHPSHVAEFTCLEDDCKNRSNLMCCICLDFGKHKHHKYTLVEVEAEVIKKTISAVLAGISIFLESVRETSGKIDLVIEKMEGSENATGTGFLARAKVQAHFELLREALNHQEENARCVVDTYFQEQMCNLKETKNQLAAAISEVESTCEHVGNVLRKDDSMVVVASKELEESLASVQQTLAELGGMNLLPDPSIPITFTKDNKVHIGPKVDMRVVTLGLSGAGKTSILFKLKQNEFISMIPTIGFNVETIEFQNIKFTIWDVGGQPKLRPLWKHYYFNTQAVIFVIDSTDFDSLGQVQAELVKLSVERELGDAAFLILANKQDALGCMQTSSIESFLGLGNIFCARSWHIEPCSSQNGQGLQEALGWLARQLLASEASETTERDSD